MAHGWLFQGPRGGAAEINVAPFLADGEEMTRLANQSQVQANA
jgi:hypothetical protein